MQVKIHQPDYVLYFTVLILTAIGVITVYSASTVIALHSGLSASHFAIRQLAFAIIGVIMMTVLAFTRYQTLYQHAPKIFLAITALLFLVLIPGIGIKTLGGRRWIGTTSLHLQPSELSIVGIVIYLAFFFTKKVTVLHSFKRGLRPALLAIGIEAGLILLEPDLGTSFTLVATALVMLFASGARLKPILITLVAGIPALYLVVHMASYRSSRLTSFLHPFQHPNSSGLQLIQGLTGFAAGGWFGRGFDMSVEKTGYLPVPQADFIFPVFTEEWGLIGAIALLVIFVVLVWRGFQIAKYSSDRFGALLSIGVTSMIMISALINLGAVTWLLPVTGIPLPFISYGGSSLVVNLIAVGLVLSVSRQTLEEAPEVDELADVVYVEDIRQIHGQRTDQLREIKLFTQRSASQRGKVEPFKRPKTPPSPTGNWRERNQLSSSSSAVKKDKSVLDHRRTNTGSSWRNRNSAQQNTKYSPSRNQKQKETTKTKKPRTGRDR